MSVRRFAFSVLALLAFFASSTFGPQSQVDASAPHVGALALQPYAFKTYDQQEHSAELGKLWVPENRDKRDGRLIQLAFVRLKSTAAHPRAPIVFLSGGPGVPATVMGAIPVYFSLFQRLQGVADVILLDQRGTGMSSPDIQCPHLVPPPDMWETQQKAEAALVGLVHACVGHWRARGVDAAAYNTNASADDVDDLRRALGVDKLNLLGFSYGTSLGLAAVRRHGEHVDRLVLASVQGPDEDLKLPVSAEFGLKRLGRLVAEDPVVGHDVPDLTASLGEALARLRTRPATIPFTDPGTGKTETLRAGEFALQFFVVDRLKDGRAVAILPALISSVAHGDYSLFAALVAQSQQDFSSLSLMEIPMTCSDGASKERRALAERQIPDTLLGDPSSIVLDPKLCAEVGDPDLGPTFRAPIWSDVTTLFLSGSMDSETPPGDAEEVRWGFPNSAHITVENGFHETLPARDVQDIVVDFFEGKDVSGRSVRFDPPAFLTVEQAKAQIVAPPRPR